MDGWVETTIIIFSSILLKFLKSKLKFFPVHQTTWLSNIAFHLRQIRLQSLVSINSESIQSFSKLFAITSKVSVLFDRKLSRRAWDCLFSDRRSILIYCFAQDSIWFGTCRFDPTPYFYSEHWMIKRLSKTMSCRELHQKIYFKLKKNIRALILNGAKFMKQKKPFRLSN